MPAKRRKHYRKNRWHTDARFDKRHPLRQARKALLDAADIARELGADVRASRTETGRVSSFYLTPPADPAANARPPQVRLSDHPLPPGAPPYTAGPEIVVTGTESRADLRLRIYTALQGRF